MGFKCHVITEFRIEVQIPVTEKPVSLFIENMPKTECLIVSVGKEKIASTGWPAA